jgi:hypothetical protein
MLTAPRTPYTIDRGALSGLQRLAVFSLSSYVKRAVF